VPVGLGGYNRFFFFLLLAFDAAETFGRRIGKYGPLRIMQLSFSYKSVLLVEK
jgi:hypothetical protein